MYSQADLVRQLHALGLRPTDTVMAHTALKSLGPVAPGARSAAHTYIQALQTCLQDGLLLIPAHTWDYIRADGSLFDRRSSIPCTGTVSKVAVELANEAYDQGRTDCVRSRHPSHSIVAFGKRAMDYIRWDENRPTPCPWDGCTGRLYAEKGKILLVGVDHSVNSFFHAVDEFLDLPNRMRPNARCFTTRDYDGSCTQGMYYVHTGPFSEYYENYAPYLRHTGAVTEGTLGDAPVRVCDAVQCTHDLQALWLAATDDLCQSRQDIPFHK